MRYAALLGLGLLTACSNSMQESRSAYMACLDAKPAEQCQNEKARFDADLAVANARSRRIAAMPVLHPYTPPPQQPLYTHRQPLYCVPNGTIVNCY